MQLEHIFTIMNCYISYMYVNLDLHAMMQEKGKEGIQEE
jgi:hypothetical protein